MINRFAFAALALLAAPVAAQDLSYSDQATQLCLDTAQTAQARVACIGKSSSACMEGPGGSSTVGMGGCLDRELSFWDKLLNANYQSTMAQARKADAEAEEYQSDLASQAEALREMQRAWVAYRDAACTYERTTWGGGTGGGPATLACLMDLTGRQALKLQPELY